MRHCRRPPLLLRVVLLAAVLIGVGAMHLVSNPGSTAGMLPMPAMEQVARYLTHPALTHGQPSAAATAADVARHGHHGGSDGHGGAMGDCVLFVATGIALLAGALAFAAGHRRLAGLHRRRRHGAGSRGVPARRAPPACAWPPTALCVIRV